MRTELSKKVDRVQSPVTQLKETSAYYVPLKLPDILFFFYKRKELLDVIKNNRRNRRCGHNIRILFLERKLLLVLIIDEK